MKKKEEAIKTDYRSEMESRDMSLYRDYMKMMSNGKSMKTAVIDYLMQKYNVFSRSTVYKIIRRGKSLVEQEAC